MTRKECLDKAAECVLKDRQNVYGKPEDCFGMIARMWGAYLGVCVSAHDVAAMMALLKIARFRNNPFHEDNAVDCAGYAACMVETATAWEREQAEEQGPQNGDEVVVLWKHKPEAEDNYPENPDSSTKASAEPEFKRGDKVEVQNAPDSSTWVSATIMAVYRDKDTCEWRYCVDFEDGWATLVVPSARVRSVSAPKAEGCEALVEHDAPQTKEELIQHIVDCNPSVYPRKPTGEELAEMAEEEGHG